VKRPEFRLAVMDLIRVRILKAGEAQRHLTEALTQVRAALEHGADAATLKRAAEELRSARREAGLATRLVQNRVDYALASTDADRGARRHA
jgi:cellobiose-specific phosphotransferase system component IIA